MAWKSSGYSIGGKPAPVSSAKPLANNKKGVKPVVATSNRGGGLAALAAATALANSKKAAAIQSAKDSIQRASLNNPPAYASYTPKMAAPSSGGSTSYSGGGGGGGTAAPAPVVPVPSTAVAAVPQAAPTPVVNNAGASGLNTTAGNFTSTGGGGTYGQFERQRQNRGPRTGVSMTPELLRRIAAQRIVNR